MTQQMIAATPDNLSSMSRTPWRTERIKLTATYTHDKNTSWSYTCAHAHTRTHTHEKKNVKFFLKITKRKI